MKCPLCCETLAWLDTVTKKGSYQLEYILYVCRDPECDEPGQVYHNPAGTGALLEGDPLGFYPNRLEVE